MCDVLEDALEGAGRIFCQMDVLGEALESTLSASTDSSTIDDRMEVLHKIYLEWSQDWKQWLEAMRSRAEEFVAAADDDDESKNTCTEDTEDDAADEFATTVPAACGDDDVDADENEFIIVPAAHDFDTLPVETGAAPDGEDDDDSFEIVSLDSEVDEDEEYIVVNKM